MWTYVKLLAPLSAIAVTALMIDAVLKSLASNGTYLMRTTAVLGPAEAYLDVFVLIIVLLLNVAVLLGVRK